MGLHRVLLSGRRYAYDKKCDRDPPAARHAEGAKAASNQFYRPPTLKTANAGYKKGITLSRAISLVARHWVCYFAKFWFGLCSA
jgi:hypothetical protein